MLATTRFVGELNPHKAINSFEINLSSLSFPISSHLSSFPYQQQHLNIGCIDINQISSSLTPTEYIKDQKMDQPNMSVFTSTYPAYQSHSSSNSSSDDECSMSPLQILRGSHNIILDTPMNSSIQNHYLPSPPYSAFNEMASLDALYGHQLQQQQHIQFHDQQVQNGQLLSSVTQSQTYSTNSTIYTNPSITPFGSIDTPATLQNSTSPPYDYYIAPFDQISQQQQHQQHQQQQQQQFQPLDSAFQNSVAHSSIQSLKQNMDILAIPQLDDTAYNAEPLAMLLSPNAIQVVASPTMSWASISREVSPEYTPASSAQRREPTKYSKRKSSTNLSRPKAEDSDMSAAPATAPATDLPVKRKRRVRQLKVKVKPTNFACTSPNCDKVFSRAYNLTSHMKTHSSEKPFVCGSCHLAFARRHDRERHVRIHTGEKPYPCKKCGEGFMRNDALHRHQRACGQPAPALIALMHMQSVNS